MLVSKTSNTISWEKKFLAEVLKLCHIFTLTFQSFFNLYSCIFLPNDLLFGAVRVFFCRYNRSQEYPLGEDEFYQIKVLTVFICIC